MVVGQEIATGIDPANGIQRQGVIIEEKPIHDAFDHVDDLVTNEQHYAGWDRVLVFQ